MSKARSRAWLGARLWLVLCAITFNGCDSVTGVPEHRVTVPAVAVKTPPRLNPVELEPTVDVDRAPVPANVWNALRDGFALDHETSEPTVERAIQSYLDGMPLIPAIETQARRYLAYVVDAVQRRQLPTELALLPIIESTLNPYASSPSGAAGLWQLIPSTAKHYGVRIDWWYDGRRDPIDSTAAALDYLTYLHEEFGNWLLAIAAYNSGEGRVRRAMAAAPGAGFFDLDLPSETKSYVPKLLALAHLIADDETESLPQIDTAPAFVTAKFDDQVDLAVLANIGALPIDEMFRFNPGLNRAATPPDMPYRLRIPVSDRDAFRDAFDRYPKQSVVWKRHVVKRGDSLSRIAKHYKTTTAAIRSTNRLRGNLIRPKQTLLIAVAAIQRTALPVNPMLAGSARSPTRRLTYTVRRGDSLSRIANRFDVSVSAIAVWNSVDPTDILRPGQRLILHISNKRAVS